MSNNHNMQKAHLLAIFVVFASVRMFTSNVSSESSSVLRICSTVSHSFVSGEVFTSHIKSVDRETNKRWEGRTNRHVQIYSQERSRVQHNGSFRDGYTCRL